MTDDTNDDTTERSIEAGNHAENDLYEGDENLHAGYFAEDQEDSGTLVVIADTMKEARNHVVAAAGETVAELNPSYPDDDNVLFCAYRNALDSSFGESWRGWTPEYLAFEVGDKGVPVYSFPESRLERKPGEWEDEPIVLEAVQIRNIDLPDEIDETLDEKEQAKQQVQVEKEKVKQEEAKAEQKRVAAEADADVIRIKGEALENNEIVLQDRYIEALREGGAIYVVPEDGSTPFLIEGDAQGNSTAVPAGPGGSP